MCPSKPSDVAISVAVRELVVGRLVRSRSAPRRLADTTYQERAVFLPRGAQLTSTATKACTTTLHDYYVFDQSCRGRSAVPGCFLRELDAGGESEFGVDVGEMGLHGAR
jgi:hypothetical protein